MLHYSYTCLTGHMLIFVMFYLIYFTNYPQVDGISCASGFQANNNSIRSRKCATGLEHCLITLSRETVSQTYELHSFDCWPWPELGNKCPNVSGVCHVLHRSKDDLHKTCCCYGHMCNNETLDIVPTSEDIGEFHKNGLGHFGLRVPGRDSNVIAALQDLFNSGIVSSLNSDSYEDPSKDRLLVSSLRIFVICGILLSTVCTIILIVFCLSPRYKKVRMKIFFPRNHSSSSQYYQNGLDNRVRRTLPLIDCFHCPKSSSFKSSYAGDCVITYPVQNSEVTHHCISTSGDNPPKGGSYTESIGSEFVFCDISERGSTTVTEIANLQLVAKFCRKEKLIGRGRFAEVWLASVPLSVITNQIKMTQDFLRLLNNHENNHSSNGIKLNQSTNGSVLGNNSNANSSWHLFCCQSDNNNNKMKMISSDTMKRNNSNTSSLFLESHTHIPMDYFYSVKSDSSQSKISSKECAEAKGMHLNETTSPLLLSTTDSSINLQGNSSVNDDHSVIDEPSMPVAVKTFTSSEYESWRTELSIFKAIHAINRRFSSITPSPSTITTTNAATAAAAASTTTPTCTIGGINSCDVNSINQMLKHIGHPNIVLLLGAGSVQLCQSSLTEYRLVMEFASSGSLRQLLSNGSWLSFRRILKISDDIVQGLGFLHSDLVNKKQLNGRTIIFPKYPVAHRDLKPENILIRDDGSVCLSDFGQSICLAEIPPNSPTSNNSCRTSLQDVLTTTYSVSSALESLPKAGTLRYQAPEIIDGAISFTGWALLRTDIYSLGLILWELLTSVRVPVDYEKFPEENCDDINELDLKLIDSVPNMTTSSISSDFHMTNDVHLDFNDLNEDRDYHTPEHRKAKKRHHWLPYEKELGSFHTSSAALQQLVCLEKYRPICHPSWCHSSLMTSFYRTITECWDHDPEARLTADCILKRIRSLNAQLVKSKNSV
ncbi:unnamed protein product [Trichobilharzia szidati]|nr:unnamed protein product [Trichobilharzia szidati]